MMFANVRTLLFGGLTGKALGVVRELVSAGLFGTGPVASAYRLSQSAFFIPVQGFLSDTLNAGFTPTYARARAEAEARQSMFAALHATLLVGGVIAGASLALLAPAWVSFLAPGFSPHAASLATAMVRVLAIAMPFYALASLHASTELADGRAHMQAARASMQSIGLIIGTLAAWFWRQPALIAAGFVLSCAIQTAWGLRLAHEQGLRLWPRAHEWGAGWRGLHRIWLACRAMLCVPAFMQVQFIVERRVASVVSPGAVAALDYARFVSDTAVILLAVPFALAGLSTMPTLSEAQFRDNAWSALRILLYVGVPLSLALGLHASWVVRLLYARGAFGSHSVAITTAIMRPLATGLCAQLLGYAGVRFLNARGRNRAVLGTYLWAISADIVLNLVLSPMLGVSALGTAFAASSIILGILIVSQIGVLSRLYRDAILLAALGAGYVALWYAVPSEWTSPNWVTPLVFAAYWSAMAATVPRCRRTLSEMWRSLSMTHTEIHT